MGIAEDYHGFYDNELHDPLHRVLDDALIEVAPRPFLHDEIDTTSGQVSPEDSPVSLVHKAWRMFFSRSEKAYVAWEREAIASWLS